MNDDEALEARALQWAGTLCGTDGWSEVRGDFEQSVIWMMGSDESGPAILKKHLHVDNARRERGMYAYLERCPHAAFPRLIQCWETDERFLLLSAMSGESLGAPDGLQWRALGAALRHIHMRPVERVDSMAIAEALLRRIDALDADHENLMSPIAHDFLRQTLSGTTGERVWCHRDFGPHNWFHSP